MAFVNKFTFRPAEWLPLQDQAMLDRVAQEDLKAYQGKGFEHPDFDFRIVNDVASIFAGDLYMRIRLSDIRNEKLVMILPSPENPAFLSAAETLNQHDVSCRNVHIFFLYEYANENGDVAPWQDSHSRSGNFMRNFYFKLKEELRMPMEQIHFFTKENTDTYSQLIAQEGGADVVYTTLSWSGGIGAIDAESYPAKDMDSFLEMGSRLVTPMPEMLAHDSLRGMFGYSGDIANVPPKAATIGPKDIKDAKERVHLQHLVACGGAPAHQKFPLKLSLLGPVCPENPGSLMRLMSGVCYASNAVAAPSFYEPDEDWLETEIQRIREQEAK